jgi:hypothetical protein
MRRQSFRARPARAAALMCALALAGCKKQEPTSTPAESGPVDAGQARAGASLDAGTAVVVETRTPFLFKDVKISRGADSKVKLAYTLVNEGTKRARGLSCVALYDKDGYQLEDVTLGPISLRGGESDGFEDSGTVDEKTWAETHTLRLYSAPYCYSATSPTVISQVSHVDVTGRPVPAGAPKPRHTFVFDEGVVVFELTDVSLSQPDEKTTPFLNFTVKNISASRVSASVCARLYDSADNSGHLDETGTSDFNLAAGASTTVHFQVALSDNQHLDSTTLVKAYVSSLGCSGSIRKALSNVVTFPMPPGIRAPLEDDAMADEPTDEAGAAADDGVAVDDP